MARKLIEKFRRRPNVILEAAVPVMLADGQEWYFPRPILELRPMFRQGKPHKFAPYVTWSDELDELIAAIGKATNRGLQILATLRLGGELLLRNYDLTDDELEVLFRYRVDDEASDRMMQAITEVVTGKQLSEKATSDPKCTADGLY